MATSEMEYRVELFNRFVILDVNIVRKFICYLFLIITDELSYHFYEEAYKITSWYW